MTGDDELGLDDLIRAIGAAERYAGAHEDLASYWKSRREALETALALPGGGVETIALQALLRVAACQADPDTSHSPFAGMLEATPIIHELYGRFGEEFRSLDEQHRAANLEVARAALLAIDPGLAERTCPVSVLARAGLSAVPPDPLDYW
jgi:hypothetical protein